MCYHTNITQLIIYTMETSIIVRKRSRRKLKHRGLFAAVAVTALAAAALGLINSAVRGPLLNAARESAVNASTRALNTAVIEVLDEGHQLPELTRVQTDDALIITADASSLNSLITKITARAQELISSMGSGGVSVDLGSAMGFVPTGGGTDIRVGFTPKGSVTPHISANLRSSGINQSLFSVELTLTAHLRIFLAGIDDEMTVSNTVPICETVIVGKVPQVYTNVANEEDMLNLVPTSLP
ncbi:MAG: hypothetical protein II747_04140 [Clostridia bacterium]|nr:hypothetical protein [Clostridia bacterium]